MRSERPVLPGTADDATLRRQLAEAEIPALLMTVAHLTGDPTVLTDDLRSPQWLFAAQGGLSERQQQRARDSALPVLRRLRDGELTAAAPSTDMLRSISRWVMGGDTEPLLPLLAEEIALPQQDPKAPRWRKAELAPERDFRVSVIGAGFSGLLAAHRLTQAGIPCTVYEKNADVGGTWFENTYPGCRTDVASHLYNYSFAPRPDWPEHFCTRDVVRDYLREFAGSSGVHRHIEFDTRVTELHWDDAAGVWWLSLDGPGGRRVVRANAVISAVGQLNRPRIPRLPGREEFAGPSFHSAAWDHSVDLHGRRVAVVGTGASAFQLVPELASRAAETLVFQRNPPWLRPTPHYRAAIPPGARWLFRHVPFYQQWHRFWLFAPGLRGILDGWLVDHDYPPTERAVSAANDTLRSALEQAMTAQLAGAPELRELVIPGYPVGAKRVLRDDGRWLATLRRDDVRLVGAPVQRLTRHGVCAGGREYPADVLVWATGFDASGFLLPMTVTGQGGVDLHETWNGESRAYLGITVPQFPNLFCLYGPNTNLVGQGGSIVYFSECAVTHVLAALRLLFAHGADSIQVRKDVHDRYNAWIDAGNRDRAWGFSGVGGWYNEGGRSATNWPYQADEYWRRTRTADPADFELRVPSPNTGGHSHA